MSATPPERGRGQEGGAADAAEMKEWTRTKLAYAQRVAHITGGSAGGAGGLNGNAVLSTANLFGDTAVDTLLGGDGLDLFLANTVAPGKDVIKDRGGVEKVVRIR